MKLKIISQDDEPFENRIEAGQRLGKVLSTMIKQYPLVLGIPRGGLVIAQAIVQVLRCDVDVILTHKIGAPLNPELAIGAVDEHKHVFWNEPLIRQMDIDSGYLKSEQQRQIKELERRQRLLRAIYPKIELENRCVVITDDGVATGATAQVAFWSAREQHPKELIGAFPVGAMDTVQKLSPDADQMICLKVPRKFYSLSQFYLNFNQVSDQEVLELLKQEYKRKRFIQ